jgi:8-oxo-dGTP diphosphatase
MAEEGKYVYNWPRPMLTVDAVVFRARPGFSREVLVIRRGNEPFAGRFALPGGFIEVNEPPEEAVARELEEETGISGVELRQFHSFGGPDRDPRGWAVTIAFAGVAPDTVADPRGGDDAAEACWLPLTELPCLAFDHDKIVRLAEQILEQNNLL